MGQASSIDLPDPLEARPAARGGTDDLLSQLAGDEIDRLLAASDVEREPAAVAPLPPANSPPAAPPALPTPVVSPTPPVEAQRPPATPAPVRQVYPAVTVTSAAAAAKRAAPASGQASGQASDSASAGERNAVAAELDAAFEQQTKGVYRPAVGPPPAAEAKPPADDFAGAIDAAATAARSAPPPPARIREPETTAEPVAVAVSPVADVAPAITHTPAVAPPTLEVEASAAAEERAALELPAPAAMPHEAVSETGTASWWVRLLELLNAPFDAVPDTLRDAAGKIAIMTILFATGILVYLSIFRWR